MKDYDKWGLGFIWAVLEMIGLAAGAWLGRELYARLEPVIVPYDVYLNSVLIRSPFLRDLLVGLGIGLCAGVTEWLVLGAEIKISSIWIIVSVASWAIAASVGSLIYETPNHDFVLAGLAVGLIVGFVQWSILRRTCSKAAGGIVARAIGGMFYFTMLSGLGMAIASSIAAVFLIDSSIRAAQNTIGVNQKAHS